MCGIAGVFAYHSAALPVDREELRRIRDHMAARGPDGSGEWLSDDGRVGLAHRRLAIIDISDAGAQPMASADGRYVITYNGELYNYRELRRELEAKGRLFRSDSDTEVLLQLFAEEGEAMLPRLRGMFAFALWDNERRRLLLARDPFGIKPLYLADSGGSLRFASQVKALLLADGIDTAPEPAGHVGFFLWGSVPEPWTLHRGIRGLRAGHAIFVEGDGQRREWAYERIADVLREASERPARGSRDDALQAITSAIHDSVLAHQVADVPVGVFLSAGIDSCLIASTAATQGAHSYTLTLGFREYAGTADDEVPLAEEIARGLGAWHSTLMTSRDDFEAERERLFAAMDQPSIDGVNTWFVARAARQMELKVALSGLGGDELLASYPSFAQVPRLARLGSRLSGLRWMGSAVRRAAAPFFSAMTSPKYAGLLEYSGDRGAAYLLRRCLFAPWELEKVFDPKLTAEGLAALDSERELRASIAGVASDRLAVSALEMQWYMRHQLLRDADWAGMAQSMEIRVPLLDIELLRQAAPWFAAYPDIRKAELAALAAPNLPPALLQRPKTGFQVPVREWIRPTDDRLNERGLRGWARFVHHDFAQRAG